MSTVHRGTRNPRPAQDFEIQLDRQLAFLRRSCAAFDAGDFDEAVRIALTIRVLVHNTRTSTSLLRHLGIQDTLSYVDTGVYRFLLDPAVQSWLDENRLGLNLAGSSPKDVGLVELGYAGEGRVGWYAPLRLQRFAPESPQYRAIRRAAAFEPWWTDPLVETSNQKQFSRSRLILIMANQDGGGHVDAELDADYSDLIVDPLMWAELGSNLEDKTMGGDIPEALHNVAFASVRQIAFELICTIDRYKYVKANPGVLALADPYRGMPIPAPPHHPVSLASPIISVKRA